MRFDKLLQLFTETHDDFSILSDDESERMENEEREKRETKQQNVKNSIIKVFNKCKIPLEYEYGANNKIFYKGVDYNTDDDNTGRVSIEDHQISSEQIKNLMDSQIFKSFTISASHEKYIGIRIDFELNADVKIL